MPSHGAFPGVANGSNRRGKLLLPGAARSRRHRSEALPRRPSPLIKYSCFSQREMPSHQHVMRASDASAPAPVARGRRASSSHHLLRGLSWGLLFSSLMGCSLLSVTSAQQQQAAMVTTTLPMPAPLAMAPAVGTGAAGNATKMDMVKLIRESCKTVKMTAADVVRCFLAPCFFPSIPVPQRLLSSVLHQMMILTSCCMPAPSASHHTQPAVCKSRDAAVVCGAGGCLDELLVRFITNALPKNVSCASLRASWDETRQALSGELPPECSTSNVASPLISAGSNLPALLTCDRKGVAARLKVPCRMESGALSFVGGATSQ